MQEKQFKTSIRGGDYWDKNVWGSVGGDTQGTPGEVGIIGSFSQDRQVDDVLRFIGSHIDNGRSAIASIGYRIDVDEARVTQQVGEHAGGQGSIIPGVDGGGCHLQAQVAIIVIGCAPGAIHARGGAADEQRVGIDVASTGVDATALELDVAVADNQRAIKSLQIWFPTGMLHHRMMLVSVGLEE